MSACFFSEVLKRIHVKEITAADPGKTTQNCRKLVGGLVFQAPPQISTSVTHPHTLSRRPDPVSDGWSRWSVQKSQRSAGGGGAREFSGGSRDQSSRPLSNPSFLKPSGLILEPWFSQTPAPFPRRRPRGFSAEPRQRKVDLVLRINTGCEPEVHF